ncbi:MAG TPA: hypothetical protein VFU86_00530 [Terriglobales bacterium]|nr:hypothetical protein [Terriglobales bacterium]
MRNLQRRSVAVFLFIIAIIPVLQATELKTKTKAAFDKYIQLTEARIKAESVPGKPFLSIDGMPEAQRNAVLARLKNGEVVITRQQTLENGKEIDVPDGMIHHWMGIVFIPGTTLKKVLSLQQDYDHHAEYYSPRVVLSKLISRNGNDFKIYYRVKDKKVVTVVMDTDYDVHYESLGPTRERSTVYSTRIQEIADPGEKGEHAKPVDDGNGFMWRLNSYWREEERDGGVYIQCEAVSLSRDIPTGLGWLIKGFVESVPRESLQFTLGKTREALVKR